MKKVLFVTIALISAQATAELKLVRKVEPIFLTKDGKQVSAVEAMQESIAGKPILKCTEVEAQASASGNVSFKNKK